MDSVNLTKRQRPGIWGLILLTGLFCVCVGSAWLWVRLGRPAQSDSYWFEVHTNLAKLKFFPKATDAETLAKLGTTNVIDGIFTDASQLEARAFLASWTSEEGKQVSAVDHTPDLCWPHVGWKPIEIGQPRQIALAFSGQTLPFECRVFESAGGHRELVVWCSLLGGRVMPELDLLRLSAKDSNEVYNDHASRSVTVRRRLKITQFFETITHRLPTQGNRQFARYSVSIPSDWSAGLQQITNTCPQWLELKITRPPS
jgi:hypothetical protein